MEFEDELMLEKKLVISGSRITLLNTRWALLPANFLPTTSTQKYWREAYAAGKEGGYETATQIKKEHQMDNHQLADFFVKVWSEFGWGTAIVEGIDFENKQATIRFDLTTVGPLLCGMVAGVLKAAFTEDVDAEESQGRISVKQNGLP